MSDRFRPASDGDGERVRQIRNEGRSWFADDAWIGAEAQAAWWAKRHELPGFACYVVGTPVVGYGMLLRRSDGRRWVSLAVDPANRGMGLGTLIYRGLVVHEGTVYAAIRRDNASSRRAAERAGYVAAAVTAPGVDDPVEWVVMRGGD